MKRYTSLLFTAGPALLILFSCRPGDQKNKDEAAIKENTASYVQAFTQKNPEALGKHFSQDATYINPESGHRIVGKEAILQEFNRMFSEFDGAQLQVTIDSIQIHDDSHALEKGTARVIIPGQLPSDSRFSAQYVKENGTWVMQNVTESDLRPGGMNINDNLLQLEWLIGTWTDQTEDIAIESHFERTLNEHFIKGTFSLDYKGKNELKGEQIIGWNPNKNAITSWIFDSDGGIGEGTWIKEGNKWIVTVRGILPEGQASSSIHHYTLIDDNTYKFGITGREIDGIILPDLEETSVIRKKNIEKGPDNE